VERICQHRVVMTVVKVFSFLRSPSLRGAKEVEFRYVCEGPTMGTGGKRID